MGSSRQDKDKCTASSDGLALRPQPGLPTLPEELQGYTGPWHERDPYILYGQYNSRPALAEHEEGSFYEAGTCVLYEDIVFRRMGQMSAFAHTLQSHINDMNLGRLVRSVRIDSCPVWVDCARVIREDVKFAFGECTALRSGYPEIKNALRDPDWPEICSPDRLLDGSHDILFHQFPLTWVLQTSTMIMSESVGSSYSEWPNAGTALYSDVEGLSEYLDRVVEFVDKESTCDDADPDDGLLFRPLEEMTDANQCGEHQESDSDSSVDSGEGGSDSDDGDELSVGEGDTGGAVVGQSTQPLDRDEVLEAFSSSRDREAYTHTASWKSM
ncbi:hypothetical protein OH76DRAFT_1247369 [Lentinus brumalis]|uniref:Uncharacterized protein n=1 Tax=Lentinus brumalis TaxID=2498619 RepID=A0A371CRV8_9APHY|nr:hypothetical protein OH76DRAFT_1247369 [Polyporus brumalis]